MDIASIGSTLAFVRQGLMQVNLAAHKGSLPTISHNDCAQPKRCARRLVYTESRHQSSTEVEGLYFI
jgi:hypothetical protein